MLTSHAYGLNQCVTDPSSPGVPVGAQPAQPRRLAWGREPASAPTWRWRTATAAAYRIDEMGSVSCNGRPGVSNTLASALWVMDALFTIAARRRGRGQPPHLSQLRQRPVRLLPRPRPWPARRVHPLYYGALMFAQAAPAGSRLLRVDSGSQGPLRAWATLGPDHRIRVLLINDSLSSSALRGGAHARRARPGERSSGCAPRSAYCHPGLITLGRPDFGAATDHRPAARPGDPQSGHRRRGGTYCGDAARRQRGSAHAARPSRVG